MQPIIVCLGARGARWPAEALEATTALTRLEGEESLLEGALARIGWTGTWGAPLVVVRAGDADTARAQLEEREARGYRLIGLAEEIPAADAIAIAVLEAGRRNATALIVPADHRADRREDYRRTLEAALESARTGRVALVGAHGRAAPGEQVLVEGKVAGPSPRVRHIAGQREGQAGRRAWRNTAIACARADAWLAWLERRRAGAAARVRAMHARALRGKDMLYVRPEREYRPSTEEWTRLGEHPADAHPESVMVTTEMGWERVETWQGQAKWEREKALTRARASGALHIATRETLARVGPEQASKAVIVNATEGLIVVDTARGTLVERVGTTPLTTAQVRAATESPVAAPAHHPSLERALHAEMDKRTTPASGASARARERACIERWAAQAGPAFEEAFAQATVTLPYRAMSPPSACGEVGREWKRRMEARLEAAGARGAVLSHARAEAAEAALLRVWSEATAQALRALRQRQGIGLGEVMERVLARCERTAGRRVERAWTLEGLVRLSKADHAQWTQIKAMPHWLIHAAAHDAAVFEGPAAEWAARAAARAGGEAQAHTRSGWTAQVARIGRGLRHWRSRDATPPLRTAWACATHGVEIASEAMWALALMEGPRGWEQIEGEALEQIAGTMRAQGARTFEAIEASVRARAIGTLCGGGWARAQAQSALEAADAAWEAQAAAHLAGRERKAELVLGGAGARVVLRYTSITRMVGGLKGRPGRWRTERVLQELRAHSAMEVALSTEASAAPVGWRKRRGGGRARWPVDAQCAVAQAVLEAHLPGQ